jgi:prevent-host-death family protein
MQKISIEQDIKSLSEFRANAAGFIEQINKTGRPIVLTQNGRGAAVVLGVVDYDALMEKIELLEELSIAEMQMNEGKVTENEEVRKQILEKLKR